MTRFDRVYWPRLFSRAVDAASCSGVKPVLLASPPTLTSYRTVERLRPRGGSPGEECRQFDRVDRLNDVEEMQCLVYLVGLQVADQVPAHCEVTEGRDLLLGFLYPVLTEVGNARQDRLPHDIGGGGLGYGHQANGGSRATGALRRLGDRSVDLGQTLGEIVALHSYSYDLAAGWATVGPVPIR